ncbi:hypothetical protein F4801DRAFT_592522 [Xylaria longipes]|nr:hypothetical protein F4801DRAFT_592522 [Xylaria longipes]
MDSVTPQYQTVPVADDQEKLLPIIQIPRSFTNEWQTSDSDSDGTAKRRTFISLIRPYLWFFDTAVLLLIAGLLLVLQVGGDYSGEGPELKWEADMSFVPKNTTEFFSDETLSRWKTLMPGGGNMTWAKGESFSTTSMTHQLHCLFMMGRIYAGMTTGMTDSLPSDYHAHFLHCIDYLGQGVMCSADMALELHDSSDADDLGPQDGGLNGHHVCKDYTQVLGYLEGKQSIASRCIVRLD